MGIISVWLPQIDKLHDVINIIKKRIEDIQKLGKTIQEKWEEIKKIPENIKNTIAEKIEEIKKIPEKISKTIEEQLKHNAMNIINNKPEDKKVKAGDIVTTVTNAAGIPNDLASNITNQAQGITQELHRN